MHSGTRLEFNAIDEQVLRALAKACFERAPSTAIFGPDSDRMLDDTASSTEAALEDQPALLRPIRQAAVLVPVIARKSLSVLLTQRPTHLPTHAGQIAFPGGKLEPQDRGPLDAALREAREEIGLDPGYVEPLGFLDSVRTRTGFHITPVVAIVRPGFLLDLDYGEVEEAFEVPLDFLMDPANHQRHHLRQQEQVRAVYAVPFARRFIWGITAGIIRNMHVRLFGHDTEHTREWSAR